MKLGIMQPYLFPWIGYFQLIRAVDELVIYDDVQWIQQGWINRNRILVNGGPSFFTLPVARDSHQQHINTRRFAPEFERSKRKVLRQIEVAYRRAPQFESTFELLTECLACDDDRVAPFVTQALRACCRNLGIETPFRMASQLDDDKSLRGQERVLSLCRHMGATHYVNAIGGMELYDKQTYAAHGLQLSFLKTREITYRQWSPEFVPQLSIIDVMMFNDRDHIAQMLTEYDLV